MEQPDTQPAAPAGGDTEPASGYEGPPAGPNPLPELSHRRVTQAQLLRGAASILSHLADWVLSKQVDVAEEQIPDAYQMGHMHGWHQRGEQLGPDET